MHGCSVDRIVFCVQPTDPFASRRYRLGSRRNIGTREFTPPFASRVTQAVNSWSCGRRRSQVRNALSSGSRYAAGNGFVHQAQPGAGADRPPEASARTAFALCAMKRIETGAEEGIHS